MNQNKNAPKIQFIKIYVIIKMKKNRKRNKHMNILKIMVIYKLTVLKFFKIPKHKLAQLCKVWNH